MRTHSRKVLTGVLIGVSLFVAMPASAEEQAPRSWTASPDVYKLIAQNDKVKVTLATWPPGKRDNWHSHPATGVFFLTDCEARIYSPDGTFRDAKPKASGAVVQSAIASHSFENRGSTECRMVITEHE